MKYSKLVDLYEYLEKTPARLSKVEKIAEFFREVDSEELEIVALLVQGKVFPSHSDMEIGIADKMMIKVISASTGFSESKVVDKFKNTGDLGLTVEELMKNKKQTTLFSRGLGIGNIFENLRKLSTIEGTGTHDNKVSLIKELITRASPNEAKYIVRTALSQLRIGVAEGVMRDSIAAAFFDYDNMEKKKEIIKTIEWAWFLRPDYSKIIKIAKERGIDGLRKVSVKIGSPYHVLLADKAKDIGEAVNKFKRPEIEFKYDGARICIHKRGDKIWLFTRRLEDVTKQFPDVLEVAKKCINVNECIIEGEMVAMDRKTGRPLPFQMLSQRIKRKYDIENMSKEIPVQINVFDIVYSEGHQLFSETLERRKEILIKTFSNVPGKFQIAESIETSDISKADKFYKLALKSNHEGVMVKNLDATYQPGRRVGYWLKVKPIMETLDLVITGAEWGSGKRANWFATFVLSCKDGDNFLDCGMMGTGIKEKGEGVTFEHLTSQLRPLVKKETGKSVSIRPKIVAEIAYEEIQKSSNYSSGFALRFPRLIRIRVDKSPYEADDKNRIEKLYAQQKGKK